MVYESDFYTTRRPYRTTPSFSTYTVSSVPSRQVRVLPGLGKVHIVHTYDRIVPYVGHKRLTVVTMPPKVYSTRPSVLQRHYDWIENRLRPWSEYSATNRYLNSDSAVRITYAPKILNYSSSLTYPSYYRYYWDNYWPSYYRYYWPYYRLFRTYYDSWPSLRSYYYDYWPYLRSYYRCTPLYRNLNYYFDNLNFKIDTLLRNVYVPKSVIDWYNTKITPSYPQLSLTSADIDYFPKYIYHNLRHYYDYSPYYRGQRKYYSFWPYKQSYRRSYEYWPYESRYDYWNSLRTYRSYLNSLRNPYYNYWPYLRSYFNYYPLYSYKNVDYSYNEYPSKRILYLRNPLTGLDYTLCPSEIYSNRYRIYRPLNLYYDYYFPYKSMRWYLNYKPSLHIGDITSDRALRLKHIFDDETRLIRAQTASLLKQIHNPVPRIHTAWPISTIMRANDWSSLPVRLTNDHYIHKMLTTSPRNPRVEYATYYIEPSRKYIGQGRLSCVSYAGGRAYNRRPHLILYEDPLKSDIQLLSYYINKFRQDKAIQQREVPLPPSRPSRKFSEKKKEEDPSSEELKELRRQREARLARINETTIESKPPPSVDVDEAVKSKKKKEEARLAEEKALAEEQSRIEAQAKKDEASRKAELAKQEALAAQAAAERAAELEKQAERARQEELAKQAEIEKARQLEEERARLEEEKRLEEEAKAEEERKQLLRLEEIARQAEEEKEAELARQAEELAELARREAELAEETKKQAELDELARQEAELAELARQEAELAELERQEKELAELAKQEAELAEKAKEEAEAAKKEAEIAELARQEAELAELARQEAELAELERQQAELDALEAEAKALEEATAPLIEELADEEEPGTQEDGVEDEEEPVAIAEDLPDVASDVAEEEEEGE